MNLDAHNYYSDPRVTTAPVKVPTVEIENAAGEYITVELPFVFKVCELCDGHGTHVNPSLDAGGLSRDELDDDPQFAEDYMSGCYDIPCASCGGKRVVPTVNEEKCDPELLKQYYADLQEESNSRAEQLAELRMGC